MTHQGLVGFASLTTWPKLHYNNNGAILFIDQYNYCQWIVLACRKKEAAHVERRVHEEHKAGSEGSTRQCSFSRICPKASFWDGAHCLKPQATEPWTWLLHFLCNLLGFELITIKISQWAQGMSLWQSWGPSDQTTVTSSLLGTACIQSFPPKVKSVGSGVRQPGF